jgi:DNA-binding MarR family transcriptional regulator
MAQNGRGRRRRDGVRRYGSVPPPKARPLGGVLEFMQQLWAVSHGLDAVSKRMNRELGVTGPQRLVIRLVGCFPGISAGDLAGLMHAHPSTLTGVLRRLERRRLLVRTSDPSDARRLLFTLTARGRAIDRIRARTVEAAVAAALASASSREVMAASKLLRRLVERLAGGRRSRSRGGRRLRSAGR